MCSSHYPLLLKLIASHAASIRKITQYMNAYIRAQTTNLKGNDMNNITETAAEQSLPQPLDLSKIHSPLAVKLHAAKVADYYAWRRAQDGKIVEEAKSVHQPKMLNDDDYYELAVQQQNEKQQRELERQVAQLAAEQARAGFLESTPESVTITEASPFGLLSALQQRIQQGYEVDLDNILYFISGCYSVTLHKTSNANAKAKK